jgi:hypothetical protein
MSSSRLAAVRLVDGGQGQVTHGDVVRAIEGFGRLGQDRFFSEYGFGRARAIVLIYGNRQYDSKAILGVAHRFATGQALGLALANSRGGRSGAVEVLRKLGFEIHDIRGRASQS